MTICLLKASFMWEQVYIFILLQLENPVRNHQLKGWLKEVINQKFKFFYLLR
jgi:hypothetical protein